jgi:hypothetical protein
MNPNRADGGKEALSQIQGDQADLQMRIQIARQVHNELCIDR